MNAIDSKLDSVKVTLSMLRLADLPESALGVLDRAERLEAALRNGMPKSPWAADIDNVNALSVVATSMRHAVFSMQDTVVSGHKLLDEIEDRWSQ